VHTKI